MTNSRSPQRQVFLLMASIALASCGGSSGNNELSLRMIQASPDAPLLNFLIDGARVRTAVPFKDGFGSIFATARSYDIGVEAILPGEDQMLIPTTAKSLLAGKEYTYIVIGKDADDSVELLEFDNPIEAIPAGEFRVQVAHAAPDAGLIDVYLTAPGDILAAATPITQVAYGMAPGPRVQLPAGTYVISVTPAGMPGTVLFDTEALPLVSGHDLLLVAVTNTTTDTASVPITLVVNDVRQTSEIPDKDLQSELRTIHVSPDAPALNLVGDPATEGAANVAFATGLTYLASTGYVSAPPDNYLVNGATTAAPDTVLFSLSVAQGALFAGQQATVLATGLLATIDDLKLVDDLRSVHAEGKLRIVDVAPGSGIVDVYVVAAGTDIASVNASFRNFGLRSATPHLSFAPDNYDVTFTPAGEKTVLASVPVAAAAGTVHTAILVDAVRVDETSDGKPPAVLLIDDLAD